MSKRYNLNEQQKEYTREMMVTRVTRFLDEHQQEVWPMLRDLMVYQTRGAMPDAESAQRLGPTALKIIREAKEEIYQSNDEWRGILTEEQKRVHDWDLREMRSTFAAMEKNFEQWSDGTVGDGAIFPRVRPRVSEPARPPRPTPGMPDAEQQERQGLVNGFDAYVEEFIRDYDLTPPQQEAARSIQREVKQRVADFLSQNSEKINEIKSQLAAATKVKQRSVLNVQRRALMQPVSDLFDELKRRLAQIPDEGQLERRELRAQKTTPRGAAISGATTERRPPAGKEDDPKKTDTPDVKKSKTPQGG